MNDIVQDLLMLSRVSMKELEYNEINLSKLATDIVNALTIDRKNPNLSVSIEDGLMVEGGSWADQDIDGKSDWQCA